MRPGDWTRLGELDGAALTSRLLSNLDLLLAESLGTLESEDARLADLPEPLQTLWYLNWLDFEVCQGSLLAYYFNSHGRHATDAEGALRRIGALHAAGVLAEATAIASTNALTWGTRRREISNLPEYTVVTPYTDLPGVTELEDLTEQLHDALDSDDWGQKLEEYLLAQRASLEAWATR